VIAVIAMIELLPAFFAASAVVGSAAAASAGALSKAACLRLFRPKGRRPSVRLLLGTALAETVIMSISLVLAFTMVAPYATPQLESKAMFFAVLFSTSAVFHIAIAWIPNLYLLSRTSPAPNGTNNTFGDLVWAGLLASMTPCAVVLIVLVLWLSYFR
jgi:hypothetical protein